MCESRSVNQSNCQKCLLNRYFIKVTSSDYSGSQISVGMVGEELCMHQDQMRVGFISVQQAGERQTFLL